MFYTYMWWVNDNADPLNRHSRAKRYHFMTDALTVMGMMYHEILLLSLHRPVGGEDEFCHAGLFMSHCGSGNEARSHAMTEISKPEPSVLKALHWWKDVSA